VFWLKARFPGVPILALNPTTTPELHGADYNARLNGPVTWLSIVTGAFEKYRDPQAS
jgi:hypothetical protein